MKHKLAVLGLTLILITLIASECGGYVETGAKTGEGSLSFDKLRAGSFACTSFAVYSNETVYGMNFDYPDTEIRFTINPSGSLKVFQMEFEQNGWSPTVGMNSAGLFSSCQMLFPEVPAPASPGADELYPWQVYGEALFNFDSVADVAKFIEDKKVVHYSVTLHDLFADTQGDAMIVEVGEKENAITRIEHDFIVMTNFPNKDFAGQSYETVEGVGSERYKIAYENIADHLVTFDVARGLDTLEKVAISGEFSTQVSMVFAPERSEVYIALKRDFGKIWKVSIEDGTIETYSGFSKARNMDLGPAGVLASDLINTPSGAPWGVYLIIGLLVALVSGVGFFVIRKRT
ncbi:MAG: hypothetical protein JXR84_28230 [Anaerolineae bacterium]|nr:hypothetical protein [Anaerolineae bacterium]